MVYTNIKDGKVKGIVITCSCGCGNGLEFKVIDSTVYVSGLTSSFYVAQGLFGNVKEKAMHLYKHIKNKPIYFTDCCLKKEDIPDLLYAFENLDIEDGNIEKCENDSKISIYDITLDEVEDFLEFGIYIKPNLNTKQYLLGKEYRAYEVLYNKEEWQRFVKTCKKYFKKKINI